MVHNLRKLEEVCPLMLANKAKKIDHVAIAVLNLESAIEFYTHLGFTLKERMTIRGKCTGMNSVVMMAGPIKFVLLEGTNEASQISQYIKQFGPGPQHIAIEVEDCEAFCDQLESAEFKFSTGIIKGPGLIQRFSARCANSGVMIEFIERTSEEGFSKQNVEELFKQLEAQSIV